jgi:hypothetical protein
MNQDRKWTDGRMLQGAYNQWLVDEHPEAFKYKGLIDIIARYTFGFGKRYGYIKTSIFDRYLPERTRKRYILKLKEIGLLDYHRTRGYTMYKLTLPNEIEQIFEWRGSNSDTTAAGSSISSLREEWAITQKEKA